VMSSPDEFSWFSDTSSLDNTLENIEVTVPRLIEPPSPSAGTWPSSQFHYSHVFTF
jgi:hypothetical protein